MFRLTSAIRYFPRTFIATGMKSPFVVAQQLNNLRCIHQTIPRSQNVKNELITALQNEIDAEKQLEQDNLGGSSTPTIPGFTIKTEGAEVTLTKTSGTEKIYISFNVNHSVDIGSGGGDEDYDGAENEQESPVVPVSLPPFSVEIVKSGGQRLCFELKLVEGDERQYDFHVEEFYIAPGAPGEDIPDSVYASSGEYIDPNLHDLLFVRYLEEHGLTTDFCQSLANFATHYEHSQYVSLLKNIKEFVNK